MKRITLTALLCITSLMMVAQVFNMPYVGSDTTTICNGTLYDHGGSSGSYSNSSNGYFYLDVPGNTLSITFSYLYTESCCDRVYVYDGLGTTGTLLVNAGGSSLPNGGSPINIPSGKATIRFYSDGSVTAGGFGLTWSGGGTTTPVAQFNVSNPNPPVNVGVSFTNTTSNGGDYVWDFGDGTFSSDANPVHAYTAPGSYSAKLIATNCYGSDTSSAQSILVMANPVYTVTPDSLYASVSCGNTATQTFTVNQTAGGTMYYDLSGNEVGTSPYVFEEGFETGLGNFSISPSASTGFNPYVTLGGAAQGNEALMVNTSTGYLSGLTGDFQMSQPTEFSYYVKHTYTSDRYGFVALTDNNTSSAYPLYYSRIYNNYLYVYTNLGTYTYSIPNGQWNQVEVKNINWTTKTFDLYINSIQVATGLSFYNTSVSAVSCVQVFNSSTYAFSYDSFKVKAGTTSNLTFSPSNGVLSSGNSNTVSVSVPTTGKSAGTYEYEVKFRTNSSAADSVTILPFVVDVTGSAGINMSKTCSNFGQVYSGLSYSDSIMIHNSGCDTLDISNIASTNSDFTTTVGSLKVPPYDTSWLYVGFAPTSIQTYTDTLHLTTNDVDTIICLSANAVGAPVVSTDSLSYKLYSLGCNDSIPFSFEVINQGQSALTWSIDQGNGALFVDDFETGTFGSVWQSTGSAVVTTTCRLGSGFYGMSVYGTNRDIRTVPLNVRQGDSITFYFSPGYGGGTYCETPDGGEYLYLQYSTNGSTWLPVVTLTNLEPFGVKRYVVPAGAISANTQFRFYQSSYTGSTYDHYIIDDFRIGNQSNGRFNPSSGTTSAGDTTQVSGYIYVSGKSSGTYTETITINSNDPSDSVYTFTVDVTVIGEPAIGTSSTCYALGSLMNGLSVTDTVPVWNDGCDDLLLTGTSSSNSDFTSTILTSTVAPGDTGWVEVTFMPTAIGAYNDSVFVQSNDTTGILCFTAAGLGAPDATVNPDSIYVSFTSCNDSITIPVTIYNTNGNAGLNYEVETQTGSGGRKVLAYLPQYRSTEYYQVKSILQQDAGNIIIEEFSTSMSILQGHLDSVNLVLIPESYTYSSFWTLVSAELKTYVNDGGTVVILLQPSSNYYYLDLIPGYSTTYSASGTVYKHNGTHPIMQGVSASIPYQSATVAVGFTGTADVLLSSSSTSATSPAVVSVHPYGDGKVISIGYDYYNHNTDTEAILKNAVAWGATSSLSDYIIVSPDSGSVAVTDSTVINVTINSFGLQNGQYIDDLVIRTNDPFNPEIVIPVVVDVAGSAEIAIDNGSCVSFTGVLQGATATDSVMVTNTGCDTLDITGFTNSLTEFSIAGLPISIAPGDSVPVFVEFTPLTVGSFNDTIMLLNNDTTVSICVNGTSAGAAVLVADTDTLEVTLNKCKVIKNVSYKIENTGLGNLSYGITIGDYVGTSQISYNTSQATTNHIFNGVPSSDTLIVRVILKGDFDNYYERAYLRIDNYNYGYVYDNDKPNHTLDTVEYLIYGTNVLNWTSNGSLDIELENSYDVDGSAGSFHRVEVFIPAQINWASIIGSATGNVAASGSVNRSILFNAVTLSPGTYHTTMKITTNAPGAPLTNVPLKLNVVSAPEISFSDSCLYYPLTLVGDTLDRQLTIYNDGCASLNVSNISSTNNAFKLSPNSGTVAVGDSLKITISFIPGQATYYNASLIITSNDSTEVICLSGLGGVMPVADFAVNYENACLGEVAFVNTSTNSPTSYLWNMGDGSAYSTQDVTHFYAKPGTYTVTLRVTNSSGSDTITKTATVNPLYVDFGMTNDTVLKGSVVNFYDSSIVATAWRWNFGDGTTSNVQNPSNTYNVLGKYTIELEVDDANNCTRKTTKELYVVNHIGIGENAFSNLNLTVYPNPSNTGRFTLEATQQDLTDYSLTVSDLNGKIIWRGVPSGITETEIDLSGFSKGMYTLSVIKEGRTIANKKLIVN